MESEILTKHSNNIKQSNFLTYKKSKKDLYSLDKQKGCHHDFWVTKCSHCGKIIGSDHLKHIETKEELVNSNFENSQIDVLSQKTDYNLSKIVLIKGENTNLLVASYTFEDIQVLKGQIKLIFSDPFAEVNKQANLNAGERWRFKKNQAFQIKPLKNGAIIAMLKTNI